ncbi:MAG: Galactose-1-phosphate uridylyltransferase [candidate division BRC1 bacterium ADurb.BinA364]|nr:MAG: Galactose-1-phosphate uridylyltransferase [candidate division BRC1 bacterium ADurb.BinA364]
MNFNPSDHPHRRFNPLTRQWVLVSPQRTKRPWQGTTESRQGDVPPYDPKCYLCPGNDRAGGAVQNPNYSDTFVYDNDFPALLPDSPSGRIEDEMLICEPERGVCRVICFSPNHGLSLSRMKNEDIRKVVEVWAEQFAELGALEYINHVMIFENREGNSSPHPHCQVWATECVPVDPERETASQAEWLERKGTDLVGDYLALELRRPLERVICQNAHFVALAPFWAVWPYELMMIPRRRVATLLEMNDAERMGLADIMRQVTLRCDNLFEAPFPYSMGIHQAPTDGKAHPEWRLHLHFTSSVLRSPEIPKFMVGYERLGEPQRDFTPEYAAARLRDVSDTHYRERR